MTAAPGPQQPDEVAAELSEQLCQLANDIEDDPIAEAIIHIAARVRSLVSRPAAPSAQPDEACPQCGERLPLDRVCLCCTYTPQRADLKNSHGPWCNGYLIGSCDCATRTPAQPVRDTEEGRR